MSNFGSIWKNICDLKKVEEELVNNAEFDKLQLLHIQLIKEYIKINKIISESGSTDNNLVKNYSDLSLYTKDLQKKNLSEIRNIIRNIESEITTNNFYSTLYNRLYYQTESRTNKIKVKG